MFTMIIGEEGEYGCRLRKYLETHWTGSLRLHSFTRPDTLRASEEKADCYLLDEHFFHCMQEELDFIHEELAFPVRVARVDDRSGLTEQIADYLKLSAGAFLGLEPPLTGNHG